MGLLGLAAVAAAGQTPAGAGAAGSGTATAVSRTAKAVTFRRTGSAVKIPLAGTELMSGAMGEAKIENKGSRVEIEAKFDSMDDATKFGLEYLTYVL